MSWLYWFLAVVAAVYLVIGSRVGWDCVSDDQGDAAREDRPYGFWKGAVTFVGFSLGWGPLILYLMARGDPPDADDLA